MRVYLRSDVVGRSAEGPGRLGAAVETHFAHAEIGDFDVALLVEHDVVQFQIAVDDASTVQVEETHRYFGRVEPGKAIDNY